MTDGDFTAQGIPADAAATETTGQDTVALADVSAADVLESLTGTPPPKAKPATGATPPNPAAQRIAAKTAVKAEAAGAVADATADLETRLRAEFHNTLAVRDAVTTEALRLGLTAEHLSLFDDCPTPEAVTQRGETVHNYFVAMIERMKEQGYTLVKQTAGAVVPATGAALPAQQTNGFDQMQTAGPFQFAPPLANASRPGAAPGKPTTFAEAAAMVGKGINIG